MILVNFVSLLSLRFQKKSRRLLKYANHTVIPKNDSPFIYSIIVDGDSIGVDKITFAKAVLAEGIGLIPHYSYLVTDWSWVRPYLSDNFDTPNAGDIRDTTFNLYLNENYRNQEVLDTVAAISKVEKAHIKRKNEY